MEQALKETEPFDLMLLNDVAKLAGYAKHLGVEEAERLSRGKLIAAIFEELCEKKLTQPTFITQYLSGGFTARQTKQREPRCDRAFRVVHIRHGDRKWF